MMDDGGEGGGGAASLPKDYTKTELGSMFLFNTIHKGSENSGADSENIVRIRACLNQQAN